MENELWLHKGKKFQRSGPDGLEAWGVAIAALFINFILAGINRSSAILYVAFIDAFQTDRMQASLPFTIRSLARNLIGPVVGIFGQKYGVRPVILAGGVLGTLSTIVCFFVTDLFWISVFWGGFSGLGAAMSMTLTQAAIGQHFVKHISTASGIGLSGGCMGAFVFPIMFESLIEEYDIQGTFLFIAGIIMHIIPAGIIMKKPTWLKNESRKENQILANENINILSTGIDIESSFVINSKNADHNTALLDRNGGISCEKNCLTTNNKWFSENEFSLNLPTKIDTDLLWSKKELVIRLLMNDNNVNFPPSEVFQSEHFHEDSQIKDVLEVFCKIAKSISIDSSTEDNLNSFIASTPNSTSEKIVLEDKDILYSNDYSNFHSPPTTEFELNPTDCLQFLLEKFFERDKEDIIALFPQDAYEDLCKIFDELKHIYILLESKKCSAFSNSQTISKSVSNVVSNPEPSNTFYSHIKTAMWLHASPMFLLICLCRCSHFLTFMPILTTVVDFSRDKGVPAEYGKFAIGILALGDLIGRLCSGWLTDGKFLSLPRYMFIFMGLQGLFTIAIAPTNSTESLFIILFVYGLLQGCTFIRHPVLISHYMGKDEQSIAIGCLNFFPGVIGFAMPLYIGYFRDTVGSYNGIFYISGSIGIFIGCLWLAEPYLLRCSQHFSKLRQQTQV